MARIDYKMAVITGAKARAFAKRGASLGLVARKRNRLASTQLAVERLGGKAVILPLDVANSPALEAAAGEVEKSFGRSCLRKAAA
jgi:NADP-dependent 3-hydroxy acid dehydrogenase YdfG